MLCYRTTRTVVQHLTAAAEAAAVPRKIPGHFVRVPGAAHGGIYYSGLKMEKKKQTTYFEQLETGDSSSNAVTSISERRSSVVDATFQVSTSNFQLLKTRRRTAFFHAFLFLLEKVGF